jgi:DMSO/TMAO reductase YedYZ molybdopterin-dependent catalytic subunit
MFRWLPVCFLFLSIISCNNKTEVIPPVAVEESFSFGEKQDMILLTDRPPNFETPLKYFLLDFTPPEVFFVRWHLAGIPSSVDEREFRLYVTGHVNREIALSLQDLKTSFESVSLNALCVCAGNSRSFFDPRVPGAQWKNGAMGNARWKGVRLKDILERAGIKNGAVAVSFNGMDEPPLPSVPDFVKSLGIEHAMDGEVMVAYEMNGEPLPLLNGYPLKLVVPGWYATYWIGMLNDIKVYPEAYKGFWMEKAYRVPENVPNGNESPEALAKETVPISKIDVRSIFISPENESTIHPGMPCTVYGLAFDGGDGISTVEISADSGRSWSKCNLDPSLGKYSWRKWKYSFVPANGPITLQAKATNLKGETQPPHQWNRSGYMRNEIEFLKLNATD